MWGVFVGASPALPLGRLNPTLPTASSGCSWLPAGGVGASVSHPFINLSHSGSFLFLLRKSHKGNYCLKAYSEGESNPPCFFRGNKIPPGFCSKQNKAGSSLSGYWKCSQSRD